MIEITKFQALKEAFDSGRSVSEELFLALMALNGSGASKVVLTVSRVVTVEDA